jgi:hypothetical protein
VRKVNHPSLNILDLIKCKHYDLSTSYSKIDLKRHSEVRVDKKYVIIPPNPATGMLYITSTSPFFIHGNVNMKGRDGGRYPYKYEEMINHLFGTEKNRIEICSGSIKGRTWTSGAVLSSLNVKDSLPLILNLSLSSSCAFTVDINPDKKPDYVADAQRLYGIPNGVFNRWMGDPPYNHNTAKKMYGTELPEPKRLLKAGARVCKPGSLMFLLLGNPHQHCPKGVKRIGCITISVIPNNEFRFLNIYWKYEDV